MSANWNYMVHFLSGETKALTRDTCDESTSVHSLYVEAVMLPYDCVITRDRHQPVHKTVDLPV